MKFNSHNDRIAEIKVASVELGNAYGELKFREAMMAEVVKSFVEGGVIENGSLNAKKPLPVVTPAPVEVTAVIGTPVSQTAQAPIIETPAPTPIKEAKAPKAKAVKEVVVEAQAPEVVAPVVQAPAPVATQTICPVKTKADLIEFMTARYIEAGKTADVMKRIKGALLAGTGCTTVDMLSEAQLPIAYQAVANVDLK